MGVPGDKMQIGETISAGVSGPSPKPEEVIKCNACNKFLPPLEPSEKKCPDGYLCRTCLNLGRSLSKPKVDWSKIPIETIEALLAGVKELEAEYGQIKFTSGEVVVVRLEKILAERKAE